MQPSTYLLLKQSLEVPQANPELTLTRHSSWFSLGLQSPTKANPIAVVVGFQPSLKLPPVEDLLSRSSPPVKC